MTIQQFKSNAIKTLSETSPSAALDVSIFLQHCLGRDKTWLLMNQNSELSDEELAWLKDAVEKRSTGLPVAYITGQKEFYGYNFAVSPDVLIPKPDTEILVEKAIDVIIEKMEARPEIVLSVCDMCTGSGCIAITLAREVPDSEVTALDISPEALHYARSNGSRLAPQVRILEGDVLAGVEAVIDEEFDVIVSNPPYIPASDIAAMHANVRDFEPHCALFVADERPMLFYEVIADSALTLLRSGGRLYFEIYEKLGNELCTMLREKGFADVILRRDLNDKPRMICCRKR